MMKNIAMAFLTLSKRGQHNWVKILCLGIGLAAGVVLIGKVGFEQSFDDFFPTSDRTYVLNETIIRDGEYKQFPQTAGGVAPGFRQYCPQVEAATRLTGIASDFPLITDDNRRLRTNFSLVDSCFFDVFPFRVLAGDARKVLSQPGYCMIPLSLAEKLESVSSPAASSNVVGQTVYLKSREGLPLIVGGIYEDIPLNSKLKLHGMEVMVSMPTITMIMWDGRDNWVGNDRYESYVLLAEGIAPDDLEPQIDKMKREKLPLEELQKAGTELGFSLTKLTDYHQQNPDVRRMTWILLLLAAVIVGCATMNYLLLVVGGITRRAREMAVRKCYGARHGDLYALVMSESLVHLVLSVALAALLLYIGKDLVEQLTSVPLATLLTAGRTLWMLGAVAVVVLAVTGVVPSYVYSHIPVATAFRNYQRTHRLWKFLLLALQLASVTFLITLLMVTTRQYRLMVNDNPGYDYQSLLVLNGEDLSARQRQLVVDELRRQPQVESVTASSVLLTSYQSGDNILLPGDDREYMNVADLFFTGDGYFQTMGIPVVAGRTFTEQTDTMREVMVSRHFEERMQELAGWDNAVGKQILCTSFEGPYTIVGIYEDVRLGSIAHADTRPSVCFYSRNMAAMENIIVKPTPNPSRGEGSLATSPNGTTATNGTTAKGNQAPLPSGGAGGGFQLDSLLRRLVPDNPDLHFTPYSELIVNLYTEAQRFRTTVLIGGLVALAIALFGLVGYLAGEVARRQKEVAIRKVNGAQTRDALRLFVRDILRVALPSVIVGSVGAYAVAQLWLQQFTEKAALTPWLFLGCMVAVLVVVLLVVCAGCYRVANSNPVNYLKSE